MLISRCMASTLRCGWNAAARARSGSCDARRISQGRRAALSRVKPDDACRDGRLRYPATEPARGRSEEHTSELQSRENLVCRLLLEKKKSLYLHTIIHKTENTLST